MKDFVARVQLNNVVSSLPLLQESNFADIHKKVRELKWKVESHISNFQTKTKNLQICNRIN